MTIIVSASTVGDVFLSCSLVVTVEEENRGCSIDEKWFLVSLFPLPKRTAFMIRVLVNKKREKNEIDGL